MCTSRSPFVAKGRSRSTVVAKFSSKLTGSTLKRSTEGETCKEVKVKTNYRRGSVTGNEGRISVDTEWRRAETGQGQTKSQELVSVCTLPVLQHKVTSATHSARDRKRENGDGWFCGFHCTLALRSNENDEGENRNCELHGPEISPKKD